MPENRFQKYAQPPNRFSKYATQQPQEPSWGDTAMDMLKGAGTGIVNGAASLAGMPQDIGNWVGGKAAYYANRAMGETPEQAQASVDALIKAREALASQAGLNGGMGPTSEQIIQGVEGVTGPLPQPQTRAGKYAKTIGEFVPGALAGPGGVVRKGLMALVPGGMSEAAGQATEGTPVEPYARIAAGLAGGLAAGVPKANPMKDAIKAAPTHKAVIDTKNRIYKALENAGIKYDANAYQQWFSDLAKKLGKVNPKLHPQTTAVLDELKSEVGKSPDFTTMDQLRQVAGDATRGSASSQPADLYKAGVILKEVDNFFQGSPLISNGSIPAGEVNRTARMARELARRNIITRDIKEMDRQSNFYTSGNESGQRNQFARYMRSAKGKLVTPAEEQAFSKVIRREGVENVLHNLGSRLTGIGATVASTATIPFGGWLGPAAHIGAIGTNLAARKIMEKVTDKKVKDAIATALMGRDAQKAALSASQKAQTDKVLRALLAAEGGRASLPPEPFLTDSKGRSYAYPKR